MICKSIIRALPAAALLATLLVSGCAGVQTKPSTYTPVTEIPDRPGLFSRVHPDAHSGVTTPAVTRFSDALHLLNDRELFDLAIRDFRDGHIPRSKEIQTMRTRIRNLEKEIAFLTERLDSYEKPTRRKV